jgi:hypothetical protein
VSVRPSNRPQQLHLCGQEAAWTPSYKLKIARCRLLDHTGSYLRTSYLSCPSMSPSGSLRH